jgi:hypothetical protein
MHTLAAPVSTGATVAHLQTHVYRFPTDRPEADGTNAWDATMMLLV